MPDTQTTRHRIVTVGRDILLESGLRAVTTDAVAARAQISKKTLYRAFSCKDELVEAVVMSFLESGLSELDRILDQSTPPLLRIQGAFTSIARFMPHVQLHVMSRLESLSPALWEKIDRARWKRLQRLAALIPLAQADGDIRPDLDLDNWLFLFIGVVRSVLTPKVMLEGHRDLPSVVRTVMQLYLEGVLTERGRVKLATHSTETEEGDPP